MTNPIDRRPFPPPRRIELPAPLMPPKTGAEVWCSDRGSVRPAISPADGGRFRVPLYDFSVWLADEALTDFADSRSYDERVDDGNMESIYRAIHQKRRAS